MNEERVKVTAGIINDDGKFKKLLGIDNWEPIVVKGSIRHLTTKR